MAVVPSHALPRFLIASLWAAAVLAGFLALLSYEAAPGAAGAPPSVWPAVSAFRPDADRPTLLLFAHPRCPCTRAAVGELDLIMTRCLGKVNARVCFYAPDGAAVDWAWTDTWHAAGRIPGVQVLTDPDGAEAARFGAATSGHALLFSASGRLLFSGGITAARGHAGDNTGRSAVVVLALGGVPGASNTPVFGCAIRAAAR